VKNQANFSMVLCFFFTVSARAPDGKENRSPVIRTAIRKMVDRVLQNRNSSAKCLIVPTLIKEEVLKMKNGRFICKVVLFTAVLALLLSLAAIASADGNGCTPTNHIGTPYIASKQEPTCTVDGWQVKKCSNCGETIATEPIIAQGHRIGEVSNVITPATCTTKGQKQVLKKCSVCSYVESSGMEDINPLGHDYPDTWTITKQPTCEGTGTKQRVCRRNSSHVETRPITALAHDWGDWAVIKSPTCEGKGTERHTCKRGCGAYEDRDINPLGHLWGTGVTTPATCIAPATTTRICQRDSSHKDITTSGSPDTANGHVWGDWKVSKKPTCTTPGQETRVCKLSSAHTQTRDTTIDPDAHVWDNGTYIVKPTTTSGGEIKYVCQLNSDHTKTVKVGPLARGGNNTICAFGPRLRDTNLYPYNTDDWYMFTPFDASQDGVQTFELVAANKYIVGTVTLTIKDGSLKVDYTLKDPGNFKINLEFFTVLNRINDLTDYEPENLMHLAMNKGQFINLQEKFGDDTNLVLYFCSRCNFTYSNKISEMNYESTTHQRLLQNMLALMD